MHDARMGQAPWLPNPEDFLEAADWGSALFVSEQGVTTVRAPRSSLVRLWSQFRIGMQATRLEQMRKDSLSSTDPQSRRKYIEEIGQLGFHAEFDASNSA